MGGKSREKALKRAWNKTQNALTSIGRAYHDALDKYSEEYGKEYARIKHMPGLSEKQKERKIYSAWKQYSDRISKATKLYNKKIKTELDKYEKRRKQIENIKKR